jgi:hypothetical protein
MPRLASPEKQREYEELKRFFVHWETHLRTYRVLELSHPHSPINVLAKFEQELGVSRALTGLKQAINDVLESCQDFTPDQFAQADASLSAVGALTLTQLWRRQSRQYKAILRRGKLRNTSELYLADSILSDTASNLPPQEIAQLQTMVAAYESQRA